MTLVVLCAGESSRFSLSVKKQWIYMEDEPLWIYVTKKLQSYGKFEKVIVVGHKDELNYMENFSSDFTYVAGGSTRQESIKNALKCVATSHVMITDVARCCIPENVVSELINNKDQADVILPILKPSDTIVYENDTIDRDLVKIVQTPQVSKVNILREALNTDIEYTDESSAIKAINGSVHYVSGSQESRKLTFGDEMNYISCLKKPSSSFFTGSGIDIHQFEESKQMVLGGVFFDTPYGMKAHSDGDVVIHSIIDALLGAIGAGDIGEFFPDTDQKYKDADSVKLLEHIVQFVKNVGFDIVNVDFTIMAQKPKINPNKRNIRFMISKLLGIAPVKVNVKATTGEKMGFVGRSEGIAVISSATVKYHDWTQEEKGN